MLTIGNSVEINASLDTVEKWLLDMEKHYKEMHPEDHVRWENLSGTFEVGSILVAEEYLKGKLYKSRMKITRIERNGKLVTGYRSISFPYILLGTKGFEILEPGGSGGTIYRYGVTFRLGWVMKLFDRLTGAASAMQKHMEEEGVNMKGIIESKA
ncbi:MAG: SRPBCC family protein [Actinobacteria bacterium]|nr:SRPBCC family protein [Actinomycetota bacterium]